MTNRQNPPSTLLRRAGGIASRVAQQALMPDAIPGDVADELTSQAQALWQVRGALLQRLMATVYVLIGRGLPPLQALHIGARRLNLRPRRVTPNRPGMSDVQVRQYHQRQRQRGRRPGQNPQMRRRLQREAEAFVVNSLITPEGHEVLTRRAATGLTAITTPDLAALIRGVRRVDTESLRNHFLAAQQRRHVLRRVLCQSVGDALRNAHDHLFDLHGRALHEIRAGRRASAFEWFGEALHLIQDSFSEAHTERRWGAAGGIHPIVFIRFFGAAGLPFPTEHRVLPPPDPRDLITRNGALIFAATESITASRAYLQLVLRHIATPGAPIAADLDAFLNRHMPLSARPADIRSIYPACPAPSSQPETMYHLPYLSPEMRQRAQNRIRRAQTILNAAITREQQARRAIQRGNVNAGLRMLNRALASQAQARQVLNHWQSVLANAMLSHE